MTTRGGMAAKALRAKRTLVQLLFGGEARSRITTTNPISVLPNPNKAVFPSSTMLLDPSHYTHSDLKHAYLQKLKELHPDLNPSSTTKSSHATTADDPVTRTAAFTSKSSHEDGPQDKDTFLEQQEQTQRHHWNALQDAWMDYEALAKQWHRTSSSSSTEEANFTLFGVGCSFSDNEHERDLRTEIMDQAGRGWFSAGQLPSSSSASTVTTTTTTNSNRRTHNQWNPSSSRSPSESLLTLQEFGATTVSTKNGSATTTTSSRGHDNTQDDPPNRSTTGKSLIDSWISPRRRRQTNLSQGE